MRWPARNRGIATSNMIRSLRPAPRCRFSIREQSAGYGGTGRARRPSRLIAEIDFPVHGLHPNMAIAIATATRESLAGTITTRPLRLLVEAVVDVAAESGCFVFEPTVVSGM